MSTGDDNTLVNKETVIAIVAVAGIAISLVLRFLLQQDAPTYDIPLYAVLAFGGTPLVFELLKKLLRGQFGSDLLAGISIVTSVILGEYLAGALVVLMLSGGEALENYAVDRASSVLKALAKRMPNIAHRAAEAGMEDIPINDIQVGDRVVIFPHEIAPVDGEVVEGRSVMDESFLTGEPFEMSKTPGSTVISGAVNGTGALTIVATKLAVDSRYARIMEVMRRAESEKPAMRRLGDQLGAIYTPLAVAIALVSWWWSSDPLRFLSVLVVATPCPLLIAIPVSIIGSISLAARLGIIIKNPSILEQIGQCKTIILDKTGTLTYGAPRVTEIVCSPSHNREEVLRLAASIERYSKHPLSTPIVHAAKLESVHLAEVSEISEKPGQGLVGTVEGRTVEITSRSKAITRGAVTEADLPAMKSGMECIILIDNKFAAIFRFHDEPRKESLSFIQHLGPVHSFSKVMIVSGDRESEVRYLAEKVGISEVYFSQSPEQKVERVKEETKKAKTLFIGDGINDAPALMSATAGIAFGQHSDITSEAAGAVILDTSLVKVDELFHIALRMRSIALQSAVGGMALSVLGMFVAAAGALPPVAGAVTQEVIDLVAVLNALRVAFPPAHLADLSAK